MPNKIIYVLTYEHKHGLDLSAFRDEPYAYVVARGIALDRVEEHWGALEKAEFKTITNNIDALNYFNEEELKFSNHEYIEVRETLLQCDVKYLDVIPTR